jgi:hypothetical protein
LIGRDATAEAEFIICGDAAQNIVGVSPYEVIRRNHDAASLISNMHVAASQIRHTPNEFSCLSSIVCKLVVNVSVNSFSGRWPSFLVSLIESFEPIPVTAPI